MLNIMFEKIRLKKLQKKEIVEMADFFKSFEAFLSDPGIGQDLEPEPPEKITKSINSELNKSSPPPTSEPPEEKSQPPKPAKSVVKSSKVVATAEEEKSPSTPIYKVQSISGVSPKGARELKVTLKTVSSSGQSKKHAAVPSKPIVPQILAQKPPPPIPHKPIKPVNGKVHPPTYPPANR